MDLQQKKPFSKVRQSKPSLDLQLKFIKRLERLITSGYTVMQSLEMIKWDPKLATLVEKMSISLYDGKPIDEAFKDANFHDNILAYLYFCRANGDLAHTITACRKMVERQAIHTKKFQRTSRYPLFLLVLFGFLLFFVKHSVYPSFQQLFASTGQTAQITTFSFRLIDITFVGMNALFIAGILVMPFWLLIKPSLWIGTRIKIYNTIPLVRSFIRINTTYLFSLHLGSLLKTGMPIKEAFHILKNQTRLPILSYYASIMVENLEKGSHLDSVLPGLLLLEKELAEIFHKNVNNEALEKDLTVYAEVLIERLQEKIKKLISIIQPAVFTLLAGLIIVVYLSLMLPMFHLIDNI
ncbi:competence type IV pilus assembly protein ComGB [Sediminibacillus massiliensis]|uniref:competence type IV pilus assembly protein ComGB n=1 Tax=Sediminibacillus massiliensis TaxID=1926277 RepID=UPI0009883A00|nr:competence type IV pilus assembly protein ComGB [Sediminibacillus massiliensis]